MDTTLPTDLLLHSEDHVRSFFADHIDEKFVYHNMDHTIHVHDAARRISQGFELSERERTLLEIAAWFHDTGYDEGPQNHEVRSCKYAREFLQQQGAAEQDIELVCRTILATRFPHRPDSLLQQILCDADLAHLGDATYWDRCGRVRQELSVVQGIIMSETEWVNFEIEFMEKHRFFTSVAQQLYGNQKDKHFRQLLKQKSRLQPGVNGLDDLKEKDKKKKKKKKKKQTKDPVARTYPFVGPNDIKDVRLGRGVETMYRTTYRTHVNLSSIADNKANIMLSINAIIISIVLSNLVSQFDDNHYLIVPTGLLLVTCLISVVFATLSTRPKVTEGVFTREDIQQKRSNLLFFGNYYNMDMDDFHWGMMEMIKDSDFLYSSMTRDLYYLGKVLATKYRYLSICYTVFMYGLITSVLAFAVAYAL